MDPNNINDAAVAELNAMRQAMVQMQTNRAAEEEQRRDLIARVEGLLQEAGQAAAQSAAKSEQALVQSQLAHEASLQAANARQQGRQPKGTIPKLDLMTYDGTGDLDRWQQTVLWRFCHNQNTTGKASNNSVPQRSERSGPHLRG